MKLAAGGASALAIGGAQAQTGPTTASPFQANVPLDLARVIAKSPYRAPASDLPDPFASLNYEQYVAIAPKPGAAIWAGENLDFVIEPLHRGFIFTTPMLIHVVENGFARQLVYRTEDFEFGALKVPPNIPNIGFSGFRVLVARNGKYEETAIFQGASFFRAHAPGQPMGVMARALSVKTGDPRGEEFPILKAVWIERPQAGAHALVIYALVDSESVVGAYRFTIRPGEATIIDTEMTLVPRVNVDHVGVATMSGASLSTPLDRRRPDDVRPTIAEVNGLQMHSGANEWIWRPVSNRATLQLSAFVDDNPKGFGFLVRNRRFEDYQDDDLRWQDRPSLWIEPLSEFGPGAVSLVEIPAESETNSNCVAYWRPAAGLSAGKESSFAYRQFWCWEPPSRPPLLTARQARAGRAGAKRRRFVVTFAGEALANPQATPDLKPKLTVAPGTIVSTRAWLYRDAHIYRVAFDIEPGSEAYSEIRLIVEAAGAPVSETWLYRWTP